MAHDPHGKESILYPLKPETLLPSKSTSHSDLLASHEKKIIVRNNDVNFFMFFPIYFLDSTHPWLLPGQSHPGLVAEIELFYPVQHSYMRSLTVQ